MSFRNRLALTPMLGLLLFAPGCRHTDGSGVDTPPPSGEKTRAAALSSVSWMRTDPDGSVTFDLGDGGVDFEEFVHASARVTGKHFVFKADRNPAEKIQFISSKTVPADKVFDFVRVVLFANDFAVVPVGKKEAGVEEVFLIERLRTRPLPPRSRPGS